MKDTTKLIVTILSGAVTAAIPATLLYLLWSWCMAQIPATFAYAGIAKIALTLGVVFVGGGATIAITILGTAMVVSLVAALLDL